MLFNSFEFIFIFLPLFCLLFWVTSTFMKRGWVLLLISLGSLVFYGWFNVQNIPLLLFSILFNYLLSRMLSRNEFSINIKGLVLSIGIAGNLIILGYYKYYGFAVANINALLGLELQSVSVELPLAISFFTFQQITYIVDVFRGSTIRMDFLRYFAFVSFFPQLIAGPIVQHHEVRDQLKRPYRITSENLSVGLTVFILGLFKKVMIADSVAPMVGRVFDLAEAGGALSFGAAWQGALAYTFQIYFDFSGYSDMAIGLAWIFGIQLPLNFNSPYKATSIIDFWRRWHITLSRFLRDCIYIPLGGGRVVPFRRYTNLLVTMLLGGLWHGAGWTFVIWGGIHGALLALNHGFRHVMPRQSERSEKKIVFLKWILTFVAVATSWVLFRAETFQGAWVVLSAMVDISTGVDHLAVAVQEHSFAGLKGALFDVLEVQKLFTPWNVFLILVVSLFPNTNEIMGKWSPSLGGRDNAAVSRVSWCPSVRCAVYSGLLFAICVMFLTSPSVFIYFNF